MKRALILIVIAFLFTACNKKNDSAYIDGEYHGESAVDEWGGKVTTDIVIKDGKIIEADLKNLLADGSEKDENYGKAKEGATNQGLYKIAQNAIKNAQEYPKQLVEKQNISEVEVITGATVSHTSFTEAVNNALENAIKK